MPTCYPFFYAFLLATCLLFCPLLLPAQAPGPRQPPTAEELRQMKTRLETDLKNAGSDTARVRLKMQLAGLISADTPNGAFDMAREALALAEKTGHTETVARSHFGLGNLYLRNNRPEQALEQFNRGLPLAEKTARPDLQEAYYKSLAQIYFDRGVYEKSLDYYRKSLSMLEKMQAPPLRQATTLIQIGNLLERTGKNREAVETFKKALGGLEQARDWGKAGAVWRSIGNCYQALGDTGQAEQAYAKARAYQDDDKKKAPFPANGRPGNN